MIAWANGISTVGKVFALAVFIVGGSWVVVASMSTTTGHRAQTVSTSQTAVDSIANAAAEMNKPDRSLPRAIPLTITIVGTIYVLAIVVGMLLGSDKIVESPDTVKLAAAIGNDVFRSVIILGALASMFGLIVAAFVVVPATGLPALLPPVAS